MAMVWQVSDRFSYRQSALESKRAALARPSLEDLFEMKSRAGKKPPYSFPQAGVSVRTRKENGPSLRGLDSQLGPSLFYAGRAGMCASQILISAGVCPKPDRSDEQIVARPPMLGADTGLRRSTYPEIFGGFFPAVGHDFVAHLRALIQTA
jgi:hypothetical protein